jgi:hypothetical protein
MLTLHVLVLPLLCVCVQMANIHHCVTPSSENVQGVTIPLTCLWPSFD